jgi:hypothetical protein
VLLVAVKFRPVHATGQAVEIGEQIGRGINRLLRAPGAFALQIVDQRLRMDFLLDVERRRFHPQILAVLRILAAPDELRVEVGIPGIAQGLHGLVFIRHHGGQLGAGDVLARVLGMGERGETALAVGLGMISLTARFRSVRESGIKGN